MIFVFDCICCFEWCGFGCLLLLFDLVMVLVLLWFGCLCVVYGCYLRIWFVSCFVWFTVLVYALIWLLWSIFALLFCCLCCLILLVDIICLRYFNSVVYIGWDTFYLSSFVILFVIVFGCLLFIVLLTWVCLVGLLGGLLLVMLVALWVCFAVVLLLAFVMVVLS